MVYNRFSWILPMHRILHEFWFSTDFLASRQCAVLDSKPEEFEVDDDAVMD